MSREARRQSREQKRQSDAETARLDRKEKLLVKSAERHKRENNRRDLRK